MSIPYVSPEKRMKEHAEILAMIAKDEAEKARQQEEEDEFWFDFDFPASFPKHIKPEDNLKASDFSDKSISPFCGYNESHYQINIHHPAIKPVFDQYVKEECSAPPISDHERILFEMRVIHKLDMLRVFKEDYDRPASDEQIRAMKYKAIRDREITW